MQNICSTCNCNYLQCACNDFRDNCSYLSCVCTKNVNEDDDCENLYSADLSNNSDKKTKVVKNRVKLKSQNFKGNNNTGNQTRKETRSTGAQLRHNDFRFFADSSSRNNSQNGKTLVIYLTVL